MPDDLFTIRLLKVVAEIFCEPVPFMFTVPVPALKVPLLAQLPPMFNVTASPVMIAPELMVVFPVTVIVAFTRRNYQVAGNS